MEGFFLKILNMSISAGWLVLAVVLLRLLLKKAPKALRVVLWGLVGLRLVLPVSVESVLSLIPSAETVPMDIAMARQPALQTGVPVLNSVVNPVIAYSFTPDPATSANPLQILEYLAARLWVVGMVLMAAYALISWLVIRWKVREAAREEKHIWVCDHLGSPFILGVFRPRIYLPSSLTLEDRTYVLAHEQAHLKRKDHWWKPLGFLLLTVHWFNPFVWLAYILLCRDIELACDEKVIAAMGAESKKPYSQALINCSVPRHMVAACPLAFGESGIKGRIKSVLNYKKPAFWVILVAVVLCIAVAVCFLTDPKKPDAETEPNQTIDVTELAKLPEVPDLQISDGVKQTIKPWHGAHHWSYVDSNGQTVGSIADASHPTADADRLPKIELRPTTMSIRKSNTVLLTFGRAPDSISVTAWSFADLSGDGTEVETDGIAAFDLLEGSWVYRVRGTWADHGTAEYAFVGSYFVPVIDTATELERLQAQYPHFFGLPTDRGLVVYVWQMAEESYSCALTTGPESWNHQEHVWKLAETPVSMTEMRLILTTYDIGREDVTVCPTIVPFSSYLYRITDDYTARIERRFWGEDDWGLTMDMAFTSGTAFTLTLTHEDPPDGSWEQLTVGEAYAVAKFAADGTVEQLVSLPDTAWHLTLHLIPRNGQLTLEGDLEAVYGTLPPGVYSLQKTVTCTHADGVEESRIYSAWFAIPDE